MLKRLARPFWLILAALFLAEAWLWDRLTDFGRWLRAWLPFEAFKAWAAARIATLPPWAALLLFIIPVMLVQPIKFASLWLILRGHFVLGALGFVGIKIVGFGAVAFLFDLTRDKLLSIRWFAWAYGNVVWLRNLASAFVTPYKLALKKAVGRLKARAAALFGPAGHRPSRLARLRARVRIRRSGLPG